MDPVTGVGLVAAVAQLITFSVDVTKTLQEVYEHGSVDRYKDVEYTSNHLQSLTQSLQQSLQGSSAQHPTVTSAERDLVDLSRKCEDCAKALQHELGKLHSQPHSSVRAAARQAARAVWPRKIEEIRKQLDHYRSSLETSLLFRLSQQFDFQNVQNSTSFADLDTSLQHVFKCLADSQKCLADSQISLSKLVVTQAEQTLSQTTTQIQHLEQIHVNDRRYDEIIESLFYPDIFSRQEQIDHGFDGIENSYEWVFHENPPIEHSDISLRGDRPTGPLWNDFATWLKSGQNLYWIKGKAGSGKSTLMNYICQHQLRLQFLREWCTDMRLLTPTHFFWTAGTRQQKSIDGLLRSLIYQMLTECRELIFCFGDGPLHAWSEKRLLSTLVDFLNQSRTPIRVCMFLDGLDEIDGQYENIARMVKDLVDHTHVKICFSSRPLLVLQEAFSGVPGLRLQDLTYHSIRAYADGQLSDLVQKRIVHNESNQNRVASLVDTIVSRADGVFLWAVIAIRDVREGLQGMVDLDELAHAIDDLPAQLESLFMLMLRRIKPVYQRDAARFLQIALHAGHSSSIRLKLFTLYFINSQRHLADAPVLYKELSPAEITEACETVQTQLLSHTTGLLEVNSIGNDRDHWELFFLHPTVCNSNNEEARSFLARKGFAKGEVHLAIARGTLALLAQFSGRERPSSAYWLFEAALKHISFAERILGAAQSHLMRSLVDNLPIQGFTEHSTMAMFPLTMVDENKITLDVIGLAARMGMALFIYEQLGIAKLSRNHITNLPNRSSYNVSHVTLKRLPPTQSMEANDGQAAQKLSSRYRQALSRSWQVELHAEHQSRSDAPLSDRAICSPASGSQACPNSAEHGFAETYLLSCCYPDTSSYDLIRSLLHAGANPMAKMKYEGRFECFWQKWLSFLCAKYVGSKVGSREGPIPGTAFEVTKALIAHGADINTRLESTNSNCLDYYLRNRVQLKESLFDLEVDATAMFVLAECFGKESEFLNFATEMESVILRPTRRILAIVPRRVNDHTLPKVAVSSQDCESLWPLVERVESTGYERDLTALQKQLGYLWRAQQVCRSAEDETLSPVDLFEKMDSLKASNQVIMTSTTDAITAERNTRTG
ncbi:MAG: hypothetical protein Q9193_000912 [Seirophora villosa]